MADYKRRDMSSWGPPPPTREERQLQPQARKYGEARSAWEARRPGLQALEAKAEPYVPQFVRENECREPGKPFELRVHVRMKNKDLVHVFEDLTADQSFLSLRDLTRKTFPTFGRRLSALTWHADNQRVPPAFHGGRLTSLQECGLADARRVEARVVYGRTNDRPIDAPPDDIRATVATDLQRFGPLALAGQTKEVKVLLEDKATGKRVREIVRDAASTTGDLDLATEDGLSVPDDAQLRRDVDVGDRLLAYRRQRVAAAFGQLPGSAQPFRAPPPALWSDVEKLVRECGPPLPRACAFFACEPVGSEDVGFQLRTTRRLDVDEAAPAAGLLGCDRSIIGVVAVPLPTARSPPPDSEGAGTDAVCRCVVHLAADEGAALHLERVFADDGADGAWVLAEEDDEEDAKVVVPAGTWEGDFRTWAALARSTAVVRDDEDVEFSREQLRAMRRPELYMKEQLEALNLKIPGNKSRDVPGECTYDAETGSLTFRPSVRLESNATYRCIVRAGRHDYATAIYGNWGFTTGEGLQASGAAYGGLVERLRSADEGVEDEARSTWTTRAHAHAAAMKPAVAPPTADAAEEDEGPLSKNKARRMRKQLLHREDELRAQAAAYSAKQAMLLATTGAVYAPLAHYKGEQLEGLDVKDLGILLADLDAARARIAAQRQRKLLTSCPDDFVCPITQELMVDPHVCADGHSYKHDAIAAWLERHETSPQTNLQLAHKHLVPNITLRNAIGAFREANPEQT